MIVSDFNEKFIKNVLPTLGSEGVSADNYDPEKYRQLYSLGGYEVTGSLTCKRDAESLEAIDADMATPQALALSAGDVFQIDAPKCIIDNSAISLDDDGWKQTIPFICTYSGATSSTIVSIKTA